MGNKSNNIYGIASKCSSHLARVWNHNYHIIWYESDLSMMLAYSDLSLNLTPYTSILSQAVFCALILSRVFLEIVTHARTHTNYTHTRVCLLFYLLVLKFSSFFNQHSRLLERPPSLTYKRSTILQKLPNVSV